MIKNIRHIGIKVKNLPKMITFYRNLGFQVFSHTTENWGGRELEICKLKTDFGMLELIKTKSKWPQYHSCWSVRKFPEMISAARKGDTAYFKDPEGNYIEMVKVAS